MQTILRFAFPTLRKQLTFKEIYVSLDLSTYNQDLLRKRKPPRKRPKQTLAVSTQNTSHPLPVPIDPTFEAGIQQNENEQEDNTMIDPRLMDPIVIDPSYAPAPEPADPPPTTAAPRVLPDLILTALDTPNPLIVHKQQLYKTHFTRALGTDLFLLSKDSSQPLSQHDHLKPLYSGEKFSVLGKSRVRLVGGACDCAWGREK